MIKPEKGPGGDLNFSVIGEAEEESENSSEFSEEETLPAD
jgi:hypothetical protein